MIVCPILGLNHKGFCVVFLKIYAAHNKFYATAGRTGRAKYQLCSSVCFQMSPQNFCTRRFIITLIALRECIVTMVAFVRILSTVRFQMRPQIACLRRCTGCIWLFSTVCLIYSLPSSSGPKISVFVICHLKMKKMNNICIRLIFSSRIYSYSNTFFSFWAEYIRIRIRFLFLSQIYSYSYSAFIFGPNIFVFVFGGQNTIHSPLDTSLKRQHSQTKDWQSTS